MINAAVDYDSYFPAGYEAGHTAGLASALDDASWDSELRAETDEALALTGKDVGTPIIHFGPPRGTGFFGAVVAL
jgi:hypothetical protein